MGLRNRENALGIQFGIGERNFAQLVELASQFDFALHDAQVGALMIRAGQLRKQACEFRARLAPALGDVERLGPRDLRLQRHAGERFAERGLQRRDFLPRRLRLIVQRKAVVEVQIIRGRGDGLFRFRRRNFFMRLRAQQKQRRLGARIRIGIQRRQGVFALSDCQSRLRERGDRQLGHRAVGKIAQNALELFERRFFLPESERSLRLPIQHIFAQQFFADGLAHPAQRQIRLVPREIVIAERERRAGAGFILRISRGKSGKRRVGGRVRIVAERAGKLRELLFQQVGS